MDGYTAAMTLLIKCQLISKDKQFNVIKKVGQTRAEWV